MTKSSIKAKPKTKISKVLVANRGEIAVRVMRTAKSMGYKTVAVYSDADAPALHVQMADEAVCLGASEVSASYLDAGKVLAAAKATGADAIHPGYGFLSENTDFSAACARQGITFIGPDAPAIELMGNKRQAKIAMQAAKVPCIPGYEGAGQSDSILSKEALGIGFPVMVKAAAGGGGRGMRQVDSKDGLAESLKSARSEATNAFGSGELILEKAIVEPRHIEIQVFADRHGHCIYLGERDCSIQRRFQKVVEESPSPFMTPQLRKQMGEAAVRAALSCDYVGAGTVEFLVDRDRNFYFLEMNTRLQVEHPVTELVTGTDLVEWQLRIAAGEPLPLAQEQVLLQGHAIEVRLYAEDPANKFMPQTGDVLRWQLPEGSGVRVDHGVREGHSVSPFYDSMLAKVIACGPDREAARRRLINALANMTLLGVRHNQHFLANILRQPAFINGDATTAFLDQHFNQPDTLIAEEDLALATLLFYRLQSPQYDSTQHWQALRFAPWRYKLTVEGEEFDGEEFAADLTVLDESSQSYQVINKSRIINKDKAHELTLSELTGSTLRYEEKGVKYTASYVFKNNTLYLATAQGNSTWNNITHAPASSAACGEDNRVLSSMDGAIIDVLVKPGDKVKAGQTVIVMEAMKMEHSLKAQVTGTVAVLNTRVGDQVKTRQCLLELLAEVR